MSKRRSRYTGETAFRIPESQSARLEQWILEMDTKVAAKQIETGRGLGGRMLDSAAITRIRESIVRGQPHPDYGAIGGAYEYSFLPTSLGIVVKVKNVVSGDIVDLSEYENW